MDELDHQLIAQLRGNARTTVAALAKRLQVARGTIQNRIARLERDGTIAGYTVRLGTQLEERGITALSSRASHLAASADMAAVRSAVVTVSSDSSSG